MSGKRQMTMAKRAREQALRERRALKQEKKQAARDAKRAGGTPPADETPVETDAAELD
jgi:hypothetical protein